LQPLDYGYGGRSRVPLTMLLSMNAVLNNQYERERAMSCSSTTNKRHDADKQKKARRKMVQASRKRNR
jgi:hypothetical protein